MEGLSERYEGTGSETVKVGPTGFSRRPTGGTVDRIRGVSMRDFSH